MPIYEYQCQACHHEFEQIQKLADAPLSECPECHQSALKKKISAAGFRLSGSGWYETDFKKGDNKKNLSGDKSSPPAESSEPKKAVETSAPKAAESKPATPSAS
jgi:putative FmdB family regulatory protein